MSTLAKINQVWITQTGGMVLIVDDLTDGVDKLPKENQGSLAILWRDEYTGEWTVGDIGARLGGLDILTDKTPEQFFLSQRNAGASNDPAKAVGISPVNL